MEIGAIFPQTELSADPGAIREFVQAVEAMGYAHLFVADHVLGADTRFHHHPSLASYSYKSVVHEPLTLLGYLAAITTRLTKRGVTRATHKHDAYPDLPGREAVDPPEGVAVDGR